jgi:hypothetical protein
MIPAAAVNLASSQFEFMLLLCAKSGQRRVKRLLGVIVLLGAQTLGLCD